jgi:hypothetical protein
VAFKAEIFNFARAPGGNMDIMSVIGADNRGLAQVGNYFVEAHRNDNRVVWLREIGAELCSGPYNITTIMARMPELLKFDNICEYASILLYLLYGWYHMPFTDSDAIEAIRNDESCAYDVFSVALPHIKKNKIIFFSKGFLVTSAIYRVSGPYPYDENSEEHFVAEILPPKKRQSKVVLRDSKWSRFFGAASADE